MAPTIAASLVARIFDEGRRHGVPERGLVEAVGRPRARLLPDVRVPITAVFDAFDLCMRHTDDPGFPMHVARSVAVEDYALLGFAMMTSPSATVVLERLARYGHLISDSGAWKSRTSGPHLQLTWVRAGPRTLGHRTANECAVAELVGGLIRGFGPVAAAPVEVHFRHPAPRDTAAHRTFFGCPVRWGTARDGVDVPSSLLEARPLAGNAEMSQYFTRVLEQKDRARASTTDRVRAALIESLSSGPPTAARLAEDLAMSERSLRRALADEGTTYRAVLAELRRDAAIDLLRSDTSVTEAAFLLGFSETSALSRAFRRWTGTSTRDARGPGGARTGPVAGKAVHTRPSTPRGRGGPSGTRTGPVAGKAVHTRPSTPRGRGQT